jgi:UDP-2,3-diacylglucosamine hydrolase
MSGIYFISDLHLCAERPSTTTLFHRFMREIATTGEALYILGDLFEYWLGDDQLDHDPLAQEVASTIAILADSGTRVYFIHGNRDFLIGQRFETQCGLTLLSDQTVINAQSGRILILHGDTLCTDDIEYQNFRRMVRNPAWQADFLAKPYSDRENLARTLRSRSDVEKSMKAVAIMDVNAKSVANAFLDSGCDVMIHGHTHRPAKHVEMINDRPCVRWVLSDWDSNGGFLRCDKGGLCAHEFN